MSGSDSIAPDLETILDSVRVLSVDSYEFQGRLRHLEPAAGGSATPGPDVGSSPSSSLLDSIKGDLYRFLYCRIDPRFSPRVTQWSPREHVEGLSAANCGAGTWMPGFRVVEAGTGDEVAVERDGVTFWVGDEGVRPEDGELVSGTPCRVLVPKETRQLIPDFYAAFGEADEAAADPRSIVVRLYWHLRAEAAVEWVRVLTEGLNSEAIPFRLKAPSRPSEYHRADAGVLYLSLEAYAAARNAIRRVHSEVASGLRPEAPRLTLRLAPGVGLAEGSGDRASFGEDRCRLIAGALVDSFEQGRNSGEQQREAVIAAFREVGFDPAQPHLAAGSDRSYVPWPVVRAAPGGGDPSSAQRPDRAIFLQTAVALGDTLCRRASWYGFCCSWTGHCAVDDPSNPGAKLSALAALGADLYEGTAGVGLFLAELYRATGDAAHSRAALGGLRHALTELEVESDRYRQDGFYTGQLGIAWAARRVAMLTASGDLATLADKLLEGLLEHPGSGHCLDIIHGNAGAILALLDLHRETGESRTLDTATTLGDEICQAAIREGDAWSWHNDLIAGSKAAPRLTGFSHGAAGIGLALLELYGATGRPEFLRAGRGAFFYEDSFFDVDEGNWPDFRGLDTVDELDESSFETAWCHGAPGIALARLRAMAIDPSGAVIYERSARSGLAKTMSAVRQWMIDGVADASLCHGLSGMVEIIQAGESLSRTDGLAEEAMCELIARHSTRSDWPSGVRLRRRNPSLFLGEAGIGYSLLRLDDPGRTPSVLVPGL